MNKREIVNELKKDLTNVNQLIKIIADGEKTSSQTLLDRLDTQSNYIQHLLTRIERTK